MSLALRNPAPLRDDADWLVAGEVARLLGEHERTVRRRADREMAEAARDGRAPRVRQAAPANGRGGVTWWFRRDYDARLARCPDRGTRDLLAEPSLAARHPAHLVERALRAARWMQEWRRRVDAPRVAGVTDRQLADAVVTEARKAEGAEFRISVRSLQLWWERYSAVGEGGRIAGLEALIPRYGSGGGGGGGGDDDGVAPASRRCPEAIAFFYEVYHTQAQHSVRVCHELTVREARRHGWQWPAGYPATTRWLRETDHLPTTLLMREPDRWRRTQQDHAEFDESTLAAGERYIADHTQCDLWCVDDRGAQFRPWLTTLIDARSRVLVGWHFGPAPHQDAILASLRMALRDWAVPAEMYIDNGKDFRSKRITGFTRAECRALRQALGRDWAEAVREDRDRVEIDGVDVRWLGITGELGIKLHIAAPYAAWVKGRMERWYGSFEANFSKTFPTYCGNNPQSRPEALDEIRRGCTDQQRRDLKKKFGRGWEKALALRLVDQSAVPTLAEVKAQFVDYLEVYHGSVHRGKGMDGRTPRAVWATATRLRKADPDALLLLMQTRGVYKVGPNGVRLKIAGGEIGYGARDTALRPWQGREVLILVDDDDLSGVWAFTADGDKRRPIGRLQANKLLPHNATTDEHREAIAEIKREQATAKKAARQAPRRIMNAAARLREAQREKAVELRRTGTDDSLAPSRATAGGRASRPGSAVSIPVRTGFEGVSLTTGSDTKYSPADQAEIDRWESMDLSLLAPDPAYDDDDNEEDLDLSVLGLAVGTDEECDA